MAVCSNQVSETCLIMLVCLITPANISTLFQRWLLVDMTLRHRTTSNQRWNNVVLSTLRFTILDNIEWTFCILASIWMSITSKQHFHFERIVSQRWSTSKQRSENDHYQKEPKKPFQIEYTTLKFFNYDFIIFFLLLPTLCEIS